MSEAVTVKHEGIEITYVEGRNVWLFELRGRERSAESLAKAKEAIDKPEPEKKKPFTRIAAYVKDYSSDFDPVEVTSIAETASWRSDKYAQLWISRNGKRERKDAGLLYPKTPDNDAKREKWRELKKQSKELDERMRDIAASMQQLEIEP